MAVATRRSRPALASNLSVLYGVLTLAALSFVGAIISVASDLSPTLLDAMGPRGRLSIPLPMTIAQIVMAVAAGSTRRSVAIVGSGFIAAALFAGVISGSSTAAMPTSGSRRSSGSIRCPLSRH